MDKKKREAIIYGIGFLLMIIFIILCLVMLSTSVWAGDIEAPQKFEVTFTIVYNNLTLEKAAEKEILLKKKFNDACKIGIDVRKPNNIITTSGLNIMDNIIYDSITLPTSDNYSVTISTRYVGEED